MLRKLLSHMRRRRARNEAAAVQRNIRRSRGLGGFACGGVIRRAPFDLIGERGCAVVPLDTRGIGVLSRALAQALADVNANRRFRPE